MKKRWTSLAENTILNADICTIRLLLTWMALSALACFLYAIIVFVSLVNKQILDGDDGPETIPYTNIPNKYIVDLTIGTDYNKVNETFNGQVEITFEPSDSTERFFLHVGNNLDIKDYELTAFGKKINVLRGVYNKKTCIQTFIISTNLTIEAEYVFKISFVGKMTSGQGPQLFTYITEEQSEQRFGFRFITPRTLSNGLRELFPCMDANDFPALFYMNITHKSTLRALSNYIIKDTVIGSPYVTDQFDCKSRLYPRQVALVLCDFPYRREDIGNITVSLYYRSSVLGGVSLRRLNQFMDKTSLSIGKLDAIVIPNATTSHQPGISVMNEMETIIENRELQNAMGTTEGSTVF